MKARSNPIDAAVARFVSDFIAIIEGQVARAIREGLAAGGARRGRTRRPPVNDEPAPPKARRGRKAAPSRSPAKREAKAKRAKPGRKTGKKAPSKRTEQLNLF